MGVGTVWIIDPKTRTGRMCNGAVWTAARRLEVRNSLLFVNLDEIFQYLDSSRA
jgi:hypothetical protein